ncbi:hypothetical protein IWQ60_002384 [Tieghemiomyces parasiticus]|uniref:Ribosomal protein/NADH dehydrogenase domain-containing protein n=1 Tax=Tieghemiomyces parasiticus TaxID=78921 RepID=A0A9W8AEX7_9FUNG|nr:hypothetical protein IWQ60_002384 [Tieghemiomyces parasiticus]
MSLPLRVQKVVKNLITGPGAVALPKRVAEIAVQFPKKGGNITAKQFAETIVPRLQFSNPQVHFSVGRLGTGWDEGINVVFDDATQANIPVGDGNLEEVYKNFTEAVAEGPAPST